MKIALDIMGGDYAPEEAIKGVQLFFDQYQGQDVHLLLIGQTEAAEQYLPLLDDHKDRFTFVEAPEVVGMNEHPTKALKEKPNSSIAVGFGMLQAKKADALVGAGNTGAMMVGAMYTVKTIEGVIRPTIGSPIPRADGGANLLLDVGLNADCKPEHLVQFAVLGSMYSKHVSGVEDPKVGLLNIGEEEGKGNILAQATYPLLKEHKDINFIGNIEGRSVFDNNVVDVIVCEGFVGNVMLKMMESMHNIFVTERNIQDDYLNSLDYEQFGGIPILGINETVIIGHGISHATAFMNMIENARKNVAAELPDILKSYFKQEA